jgi:hypothetical protein
VPATIEVGTGDPELPGFEPLPEDGRLPLFLGPQAGYHVYIQARVEGLCPNSVAFDRWVREPGETDALRHQTSKQALRGEGGGAFAFPHAVATFICPATEPGIRMDNRSFDLDVTLSEQPTCGDAGAGEPVSVSKTVTIVPTCSEYDADCTDTSAPGCAPY